MTQEQQVLEIIKLRFGIEDRTQDALINSYITELGRRIRNYCNRSDIPDDLISVWASMVMDALKVEHPDQFGGDDAEMSIKIGDTSIAPAKSNGVTSTSKGSVDKVVLDYKADLHRWRKMRW